MRWIAELGMLEIGTILYWLTLTFYCCSVNG